MVIVDYQPVRCGVSDAVGVVAAGPSGDLAEETANATDDKGR
jgi:hypothetical protein